MARRRDIDVSEVKLAHNPDVWLTEVLWASLLNAQDDSDESPWIVGGDLNASETFDAWRKEGRGNRQLLDRMIELGLVEVLRHSQGALVPTFKNTTGGAIKHQMDHLFVSQSLAGQLVTCMVGEHDRVFGKSLSDHLPIVADFHRAKVAGTTDPS